MGYLFAGSVTDASATYTAQVIVDLMTKQSYLPTTPITDKRTFSTLADDANPQDETCTDVDLWSTGSHESENPVPTKKHAQTAHTMV